MVATVNLHVFTGANAATESAAVTGIDLISADNATNSLANRQANPVTIPAAGTNYSFEKWIRAKIAVVPDNYVQNFQFWTDGAFDTGVGINVGTNAAGVTPIATVSTIATTDGTTYVSGAKLAWHAGQLSALNATTDALVLQMAVGTTAVQGNVTQESLNYSYDEL